MLDKNQLVLWYGSEDSHLQAMEIEANVQARLKAGGPFDDVDPDYLLSKQGKVGVISIRGPLMNGDSPFHALFGVSTYPAIRRALVAAAKDASIEKILLHIDSGGGAVSGVADTAELIKRVDKVKPVTTFTDGAMASAAYWLGVTGRERIATSTAEVGSIGVLQIHLDRSKQLAQDGIKATVIRSGPYKALGTPFEPLSERAREQMQSHVDAAYRVFGDHVAAELGMTFEAMDKKVGQGRMFFGQQAKDAGLVDLISNLDGVVSRLTGGATVDKRRAAYDNGIIGDLMNPKKPNTLTDAEIAAIAAGAPLAVANPAVADPAVADPVVAPAPAVADPAVADPVVAPAAAVEPVTKPVVAPSGDGLVAFLQAQNAEKDAKLTQAAVDKSIVDAKLAGYEASHGSLVDIARAAVSNMRVALGGTAGDVKALGPVEVAAEHARLATVFNEKFKVGGVAATAPSTQQGSAAAATPLHSAKLAATRA